MKARARVIEVLASSRARVAEALEPSAKPGLRGRGAALATLDAALTRLEAQVAGLKAEVARIEATAAEVLELRRARVAS